MFIVAIIALMGCIHPVVPPTAPTAPTVARYYRACWVWELDRVKPEWQAQVAATAGVSARDVEITSVCSWWCTVTATVQ